MWCKDFPASDQDADYAAPTRRQLNLEEKATILARELTEILQELTVAQQRRFIQQQLPCGAVYRRDQVPVGYGPDWKP